MKALKNNLGVATIIVGLVLAVALIAFLEVERAHGNTTTETFTPSSTFRAYTFFASTTNQLVTATTTSATSTNIIAWTDSNTGTIDNGYFPVRGAKKITFYFQRGDISGQGNTGTSTFRVQVTPDGTNWFYWGKWTENASSTIGFTPTAFSNTAITLTGTSTISASMVLLDDQFLGVRCIVVEGVDGEHTCKATATF